jgi:hypothetical protein
MGPACQKGSSNHNNGNNTGLATQPTAMATYDNQSGGVYKGTLSGSSGYFEINLQGTAPYLLYQWTNPAGNKDSLSTTSLANWSSGQAIVRAVFTAPDGSLFWFSVNADGSSPSIDSVYIPGHTGPVYAAVGKEFSNSLLEVYQGSATLVSGGSGCYDAIVNVWLRGSTGDLTYVTPDDHGTENVSVSGNQAQVTVGPSAAKGESGTLTISADGSSMSGTVSNSTCTHSISLTRIL